MIVSLGIMGVCIIIGWSWMICDRLDTVILLLRKLNKEPICNCKETIKQRSKGTEELAWYCPVHGNKDKKF